MIAKPNKLPLISSAENLRRLAIIRSILITALLAALAYAFFSTQSDMISPSHLSILAVMALVNMLTYWRLQQNWPVTDAEYFFQLIIDISGLSALLYFSGGATNPFVSFYLVPLTISAAILPWRFTWFIAGFTLTAYSLMLFYYLPLPLLQPSTGHMHNQGGNFNLHIIGMWLTFALSTVLITFFVVKMAHALRQQDREQTVNRENDLRNEQILAVATLAAGTAHELGTPLATMTVLLDEMEFEYKNNTDVISDVALLKEQTSNCRKILQGLVTTAESSSNGNTQTVLIIDYLKELLNHWQVLRPTIQYQFNYSDDSNNRFFQIDLTLKQAITHILNNAADACPDNIEITLSCEQDKCLISIRDHGEGISSEIANQMGKPFISTKRQGLGLGLFLSHATMDRYEGTIELHNCSSGGTLAEITLPIIHND